jgi:hypothetical protein
MNEGHDSNDKEKEPLLPRTAAGATIVAIPLATVLGGLGWVGQKVLLIDEIQQQHHIELANRGDRLMKIEEIAAGAEIVRTQVETSVETIMQVLGKMEERQVSNMQRLTKVEAIQEHVQQNRDDDIDWLEERMSLIEERVINLMTKGTPDE